MPAITPRPGNGGGMVNIPSPNPRTTKSVKGISIKAPKAKGPIVKIPSPNPKASKGINIDDRILRTMPITEVQLKGIKKHYGIK